MQIYCENLVLLQKKKLDLQTLKMENPLLENLVWRVLDSFRVDSLLCPRAGIFFDFFIKTVENHPKLYFSNLVAPGWKTWLTPGMGMGGDHLEPLRTILGPLYVNKNMFFNQKLISLKWHILTSSPLFDKDHPSP